MPETAPAKSPNPNIAIPIAKNKKLSAQFNMLFSLSLSRAKRLLAPHFRFGCGGWSC